MLFFFDVDGVLSAPQYWDADGSPVIGFSDQDWISFCEREGEDAYRACRPVPTVMDYVKRLHDGGDVLFVLSTTSCPDETRAKIKYLDRSFPGMFTDYYFVDHDVEKIEKIKAVAADRGCALGDCALVEDTFTTLLLSHEAGIRSIHISNILAGNISG